MSRKTNRSKRPELHLVPDPHDQILDDTDAGKMRFIKAAALASAAVVAAVPNTRHEVAGFVSDAANSITMPGTPHVKNPSPEQLQAEAQQSGKFTVEADPSNPDQRIVRYRASSGYTTEDGIIQMVAPGQDRALAEKAFEANNPTGIAPDAEVSLVLDNKGDILPEKAPPEEHSSQPTR